MKSSTRATTPIHTYELIRTLSPWPKNRRELSSLSNHSEVPLFNIVQAATVSGKMGLR
jgi:hypothetical protein